MGPEDPAVPLERVVRCDGASLEEARAKAREMCAGRTVLREVVVASGGRFTVKLNAESMATFRPICHVGWRSAASGVTAARAAVPNDRNGPPDAVSTSRLTSAGARPWGH